MRPDTVTLIANFIPFQKPDGGPNFYPFDPNVLYEIHIDNNGDAVEDITFQWRFTTEVRNPQTFLYNTGPVTSLDDPDLERAAVLPPDAHRRSAAHGHGHRLSGRLPVPPPNIGPRSTPNYGALGGGIQQSCPATCACSPASATRASTSISASSICSASAPGQVEDSTAGFNVSTPRDPGAEVGSCRAAASTPTQRRAIRTPSSACGRRPAALRRARSRAGAQTPQRRTRPGVAPRQSARQRSRDRSRAQGRVQRASSRRATRPRSIA